MRILISNDDGVYAEGIAALATALSEIAEVSVVAPDRNRSGASNSLTLVNPLRTQKLPNGYISVTGTPTDCVHIALNGIFIDEGKKFDMVVSGINQGQNLGDDVLYSGTVAAAMEGRSLGLPSIAVSLAGHNLPVHYKTAALITKRLVEQLVTNPLPASTILNVNVPDVPLEEIQGFEITRLGSYHPSETATKGLDPRGHEYYWVGAPGQTCDSGPGTDFHAIKMKRISITPLKIDMTNHLAFDQLSNWISKIKDFDQKASK